MKTIPVISAAEIVVARPTTHKDPPPPWRLVGLLAAPHRLAFFLAATMLVLGTGLTLMPGGRAIALIGFHFHTLLACIGVAGVATSWTILSLKFLSNLHISKVPDRVLARALAVTCGLGHSIRTMVWPSPPGWMPRLNPT